MYHLIKTYADELYWLLTEAGGLLKTLKLDAFISKTKDTGECWDNDLWELYDSNPMFENSAWLPVLEETSDYVWGDHSQQQEMLTSQSELAHSWGWGRAVVHIPF